VCRLCVQLLVAVPDRAVGFEVTSPHLDKCCINIVRVDVHNVWCAARCDGACTVTAYRCSPRRKLVDVAPTSHA
jgi:hypothetical protein